MYNDIDCSDHGDLLLYSVSVTSSNAIREVRVVIAELANEPLKDCSEIWRSGQRYSGVFRIDPSGQRNPDQSMEVYCRDGWTYFLYNINDIFSPLSSELGLLTLHHGLTWADVKSIVDLADDKVDLRIETWNSIGNVERYVDYDDFKLNDDLEISIGESSSPFLGTYGGVLPTGSRFIYYWDSSNCANITKSGFYDPDCNLVLDVFGLHESEAALWPTGFQAIGKLALALRPWNHDELPPANLTDQPEVNFTAGSVLSFHCVERQKDSIFTTITKSLLGRDGIWSQFEHDCEISRCETLPDLPPNSFLKVVPFSSDNLGTSISYKCPGKMKMLYGNTTILQFIINCQNDGTYDLTNITWPICYMPNECPDHPPDPEENVVRTMKGRVNKASIPCIGIDNGFENAPSCPEVQTKLKTIEKIDDSNVKAVWSFLREDPDIKTLGIVFSKSAQVENETSSKFVFNINDNLTELQTNHTFYETSERELCILVLGFRIADFNGRFSRPQVLRDDQSGIQLR